MRVVIAGGGTGGHISPAVAIIEELYRRDPNLTILWIGRKGGLEERVCSTQAIPFRGVPVEGWPRSNRWRKPWVALKLAVSVLLAALHLRKAHAQLVIGVGSYVSLPALLAAQRLGIPTVVHEQNKRLGMANRMTAPKAERIFLSYPDTVGTYPEDKAVVVGNPVRAGFMQPQDAKQARRAFELEPHLPVVLACGGSQGAHSINQAMTDMLHSVKRDEFQLVWMTGKHDASKAREVATKAPIPIRIYPYIDDMVSACAAADLVVTRSGASTTAELALMGKPSLLIPYPHATDNHQEANARAFEGAGAAEVLLDADCTGKTVLAKIRALVASPEQLDSMGQAARTLAKPGAAATMVEDMLGLVFEE